MTDVGVVDASDGADAVDTVHVDSDSFVANGVRIVGEVMRIGGSLLPKELGTKIGASADRLC